MTAEPQLNYQYFEGSNYNTPSHSDVDYFAFGSEMMLLLIYVAAAILIVLVTSQPKKG